MIGARDRLDKKLVQLYQNVRTVNFDSIDRVNSNDMWNNIGLLAQTNKAFFDIQNSKKVVTAAC